MPEVRDPLHEPPPYDPSDRRDVGTGKDFAADLLALYRAGRLHFPEVAAFYSGVTTATHEAALQVRELSAVTGGEYALTLVDRLREVLQVELRRTSLAMSETGEALIEIADDYSTTDRAANDHFRALLERKVNQIDPPVVPSPPGLDAPFAGPHDPLVPTSPPLLPPDRGLEDLVPEEPTQEHAPTPHQQAPWLFPEGTPGPEPEPEPESPFAGFPGPFGDLGGGSDLDDGENELYLDDLVETPEERRERLDDQLGGLR